MNKKKKIIFIVIIFIASVLRFFISYKLPSFYLVNLKYDDLLMIKQLDSLTNGLFLGNYSDLTLIKGMIFPLILYYIKLFKLSFSVFFTIIYILSCLYFIYAFSNISSNKKVLIILYIILLFNPVTYSSELFQRLYINTISISELLLFLGSLIIVLFSKEEYIINYIILGTISSIMLVTRNDNIWIYIVLLIVFVYKVYKNYSFKKIIINIIPFIIIILGFNILSFVNYKYYDIYTYNELENSSFSKAYNNITKIKDGSDNELAIKKETFYKLSDKSKVFGFTREEIDNAYKKTKLTKNGEIDNGNIIWFFRGLTYTKYKFKNGKEADLYFKKLNNEIELLFKKGELKKKSNLPTIFINNPSKNLFITFPKSFVYALWYTSSYKNVRTYSYDDLNSLKTSGYDYKCKAFGVVYHNYRYAENMITHNPVFYEIIRIIYAVIITLLSIPALIIYIKNIKSKNKIIILEHILLLIYLLIMCGVVYTHVTAFNAIRYRYLSNIYIIQSIFIFLNILVFIDKKNLMKGVLNDDFSNYSGIQRRKSHKKNNKRNSKSTKRKKNK